MGLSITVGILADLAMNDPEAVEELTPDFEIINRVLRLNRLPEHREPTTLPMLGDRSGVTGLPYSFLHRLRRFYARRIIRPDRLPPPVAEGESPAHDPVLDEVGSPKHHLLWHSDCEGYYLPIDFSNVLEDARLPGAGIGSSVRLLEELKLIASPLGIMLQDGTLSDSDASLIAEADEDNGGPYWIERLVWLALFEAARLSIEHHAAIHFG